MKNYGELLETEVVLMTVLLESGVLGLELSKLAIIVADVIGNPPLVEGGEIKPIDAMLGPVMGVP